jgi:hypothetical protein
MARLKQAADGHLYIRGRHHGGQWFVWQVSPEGISFLEGRGFVVNESIPKPITDYIWSKNWLWVQQPGGGTPEEEDKGCILEPAHLERLKQWAAEEPDEQIADVMEEIGLAPNCWYVSGALKWLSGIGGSLCLSDLARAPRRDLLDVCQHYTTGAPRFYEALLDSDGMGIVIWRLIRIIGSVAEVAEVPTAVCLPEWIGGFRERLFRAIRAFLAGLPQVPRLPHPKMPVIRWEIDRQRLVAVLPEQQLPEGFRVRCRVEMPGSSAIDVPIGPVGDDTTFSEWASNPLSAFRRIACTATYTRSDGSEVVRRLSARLEGEEPACWLFDDTGELVSPEQGDAIPPGHYYALFEPGPDSHREGFDVLDEEIFEPNGWGDWQVQCLCARPGATWGPYRCTAEPLVSLKLSGSQVDTVEFIRPCPPVYVGQLPSLVLRAAGIQCPADYRLEVECVGVRRHNVALPPVAGAEGSEFTTCVDLSNEKPLRGLWGRFEVRLLGPQVGSAPLPTLSFVGLLPLALRYVDDWVEPDRACAVELSMHGTEADVQRPESGDLDLRPPSGSERAVWKMRCLDPVASPEVLFSLKLVRSGQVVRLPVRVPVTRARLQDRRSRFGEWQSLPIRVALADIGPETRLLAQFHRQPLLEGSELFCQHLSGAAVAAGKFVASSRSYEIPLHRWRDALDAFGPHAGGQVRVRCKDRWMVLAVLAGTERPPLLPPADPVVAQIQDAVMAMRFEEAVSLARQVLMKLDAASLGEYRAEDRRLAAGHALLFAGKFDKVYQAVAPLVDRVDLQAAALLAVQARLRQGPHTDQLIRDVGEVIEQWPDGVHKDLARGECWYRLARLPAAVGSQGLVDAENVLKAAMSSPNLTPLALLQAQALHAVVCFVLGRQEEKPPPVDSRRGMDDAVLALAGVTAACTCYLATPLSRWTFSGESGLPPSPPVPALFDGRDWECISACYDQARRRLSESGDALARLADEPFCHPLPLLRARQARLEGRMQDARRLYLPLLNRYPVVIDEMP